MCFNVKIFMKMLKILALTANLGHISRVQKPGLRPTALAFLYPRLGQKPAQAKGWARLGPAFFGLAWPGFWPQAGAGTSLVHRYSGQMRLMLLTLTPVMRNIFL